MGCKMNINKVIPDNRYEDVNPEREDITNVSNSKNSKLQQQESTQENIQDLDQQQQVDVKPSQVNVQRLVVTINNKIENYSGKITGTIYTEENSLASNAAIALYFGNISELPVLQLNTDSNGNFIIENLPPGYYTLRAFHNEVYSDIIPNIKILPGENITQNIYLKNIVKSAAHSHHSKNKKQ